MTYPRVHKLLVSLLLLSLSTVSWAISTEEEIQLGSQAAAQFEQKYGLVTDPAMVGRLNRVAGAIVQNAERQDLPWRFRVINIDAFNAAAFPGGFVYATKGLMQGLTDEELAFVVGHEIGHADFRHSIKQLESAQLRRLGLIAVVAGAGGGNVDGNAATLVQLTDGVISSQYSQGDEAESDRYGMKKMAEAGYDPVYAISALRKLAAQGGGGTPDFLNTILGSHPLPKKRISQGVELVKAIPFRPQVSQPVAPSSPGNERLFTDASTALEYTLSLLGQNHRSSLQAQAEDIALGRRASAPRGTRLVRVKSARNLGLSGLENTLLARSEFDRLGQAFGAAVVDAGGGQIEAVVLLQGGR